MLTISYADIMHYFYQCVTDIISGLLVSGVAGIVGYLIIKTNFKKILVYKRLRSYGFLGINGTWQTTREVKQMCKNAKQIKIINVSGVNYYKTYKTELLAAMKNGAEVQVLIADPDSGFLTDIEEMEKNTIRFGKPIREENTFIKTEIEKMLVEYGSTPMRIRLYNSEYRLPFILAYYRDSSVHAWLSITLPPLRSGDAMVLRGERKPTYDENNSPDMIEMMETSFDTIWRLMQDSDKKVEKLQLKSSSENSNT